MHKGSQHCPPTKKERERRDREREIKRRELYF
jgi:hypothetical protein